MSLVLVLLVSFLVGFSAVAAAKNLVVYTPAGENLIQSIIPLFEKETGIKVEVIAASTGELLTRIQNEANNPIADVMWGGSPSLIKPLRQYFEDYVSVNDQYLPPEYRNTEGYITRFNHSGSVLLVNTDLLADLGVEVKGYKDLLNPALKGLIAHGDATSSSSAFNHLENILVAMGKDNDPESDEAWEFVEAFLRNLDGKIIQSSGAIHRGVAAGEYAVGLSYTEPGLEYMDLGAPVKVVYMEEGTMFKNSGVYIVKGAKNLENAQLFADFLISEKVQELLGMETYNLPIREDVQLASFKTPMSEINVLHNDEEWAVENKAAIIERYMDVLTKVMY